MNRINRFTIIILTLLTVSIHPATQSKAQEPLSAEQENCILDLIRTASDQLTLGEAREMCEAKYAAKKTEVLAEFTAPDKGVVEERLSVDKTNILKPFTLMAHHNNYILLGAHNFHGWDSSHYQNQHDRDDIYADDTEVQFQLSVKLPLAVNLFDKNIDIFGGYTVTSFWQLYNRDESSPFRETNYQPEIWMQVRPEWELFGFKNTVSGIGINHMSNGQGGTLSRSWNRVSANFGFERGNLAFMLNPWIRIQEDSEDDDNPDITDYYGHGELWLAYKHKKHTFSLMTRNNIESGFSNGAIELGWSFPIFNYPYFKGYIQYFSGYGESLIDYDRYVNRLGVGIQFTDFL